MKRGVLLSGLGILGFFLLAGAAPLCPQQAPAKKQAKPKGIEGFWTQVHSETEGDRSPSMANLTEVPPGPLRGTGGIGWGSGPYTWKFSKEEVGSGFADLGRFPRFRSHYQLNPGGETGAIDMISLDEKGKKIEAEKWRGIYLLKDDILMICHTFEERVPRPKAFTTSANSQSRLVILRRGKLK